MTEHNRTVEITDIKTKQELQQMNRFGRVGRDNYWGLLYYFCTFETSPLILQQARTRGGGGGGGVGGWDGGVRQITSCSFLP